MLTPPIAAQDDVIDVASVERRAGLDENKRYFLIGTRQGDAAPDNGYGLLIVLPGGDGGRRVPPRSWNAHLQATPCLPVI